jgi:hypothetical protein
MKDSRFGSWSTTQVHTNDLKDKRSNDKNKNFLVLKTIKKMQRSHLHSKFGFAIGINQGTVSIRLG